MRALARRFPLESVSEVQSPELDFLSIVLISLRGVEGNQIKLREVEGGHSRVMREAGGFAHKRSG